MDYPDPEQMRALRACAVALVLPAVLAACGGSGSRSPSLATVPLVPGAHVVAQVHQCDAGASTYCAVQVVVRAGGYHSSDDLLLRERHELHAHGWTGANGATGEESAADSPGHKLHLTYATASEDLDGIDQGWIKRAQPITLALSRSIFDGRATLSMMLEVGNS